MTRWYILLRNPAKSVSSESSNWRTANAGRIPLSASTRLEVEKRSSGSGLGKHSRATLNPSSLQENIRSGPSYELIPVLPKPKDLNQGCAARFHGGKPEPHGALTSQ